MFRYPRQVLAVKCASSIIFTINNGFYIAVIYPGSCPAKLFISLDFKAILVGTIDIGVGKCRCIVINLVFQLYIKCGDL